MGTVKKIEERTERGGVKRVWVNWVGSGENEGYLEGSTLSDHVKDIVREEDFEDSLDPDEEEGTKQCLEVRPITLLRGGPPYLSPSA